jgi:hypothetical protein
MRSNLHIRARGFAVALLALVAIAGCIGSGPPVNMVDGWSIAEGRPCLAGDAKCLAMVEVATTSLAGRDPGHPPIDRVSLHAEGLYPDGDGVLGQIIRSGGPPSVVVFQLTDGTRRAIGVKYVLRDEFPTAFEYGPERRPGRGGGGPPAPTI